MTPLYMSIPVLIWLSLCAWFDWKSRRVSNWLTLPVLGVAISLRTFGYGRGDGRFVLLLSLIVLMGWAARLVGGADAKASLAIVMMDPIPAMWAWAGGVGFYLAILFANRARRTAVKIPGFMGFTIGVFAYICFCLVKGYL